MYVCLYSVMMKNCNAEFLLMKIFRMFFVTVVLCCTVFMVCCRAFRSAAIWAVSGWHLCVLRINVKLGEVDCSQSGFPGSSVHCT